MMLARRLTIALITNVQNFIKWAPLLSPHTLFVYMGVLVSNFCQELAVSKAPSYLFPPVKIIVHLFFSLMRCFRSDSLVVVLASH